MKLARLSVYIACYFLLAPAFAAPNEYVIDMTGAEKASHGVEIVQLREDSFLGSPDGSTPPPHSSSKKEKTEGIISQGVYSSPYQGYQIKVPRVSDNTRVHVHQALISSRPDGKAITSHVLFIPDGGYGAAAVVVTRLRDDRSKEPNLILAQFAPRNASEAAMFEQQGVFYRKLSGSLGNAVQRIIKNRAFSWHFPYRVVLDTARPSGSVGISRYVVIGDFLCEFSMIIDGSKASNAEALQMLAEKELDMLMGAMVRKPQ